KYFYYLFLLLALSTFTACSYLEEIFNSNFNKCKNECPTGQQQKDDCSCFTPEKHNADEAQQIEILQSILEDKEGKLYNLLGRVLPDSPLNLQLLPNMQEFKNLYASNREILNFFNYQTSNLTTLSLLAPLEGFNGAFKFLLDNGANPNLQAFNGVSPLQLAILADQDNKVKMLLDAGATASFEGGNNILINTLNLKKYKALRELSTYAKNKNIDFTFPSDYFIEALANKNNELAAAVLPLTNKETLNTPNNFGILPLVQAAYMNNTQIIDILVDNGADLELKDVNSRTPILAYLHEVYIGQIEGNYPPNMQEQNKEIIKHMLDKGADVKAKDKDEEDILFYAVRTNNFPLIELLVSSYGADINTRNKDGETPLFVAAQNQPGMVPMLLQKGANPKVMDSKGRTPAIAAVEMGFIELYEMLENAPAPLGQN
nr:ankyrin repeat domain-containing protein [Elusimicrobiaceae bacterium]